MKTIVFNENFWSAVKRKNLLDVLSNVFGQMGEEEAAKIASETNRFTNASVERMMKAIGSTPVEDGDTGEDEDEDAPIEIEDEDAPIAINEEDETEVEDTPVETSKKDKKKKKNKDADTVESDEVSDIVDHTFTDIRKAIKKGKGKKALKLIKEAKDNGARGSVLKELEAEAKAL